MSTLQFHWEDRFLNRENPWILKPQRDHLQNLSEDLQAALNCLQRDPKLAVASLEQKILHPFCYLICGGSEPRLLAQGAAATAEQLLGQSAECPGNRAVHTVAFHRVRDCRDNQACIVQECQLAEAGGRCGQCRLQLIWKPMTNGEWRLFVFATSSQPEAEWLGFKRVLDI